jgi:hypothetical protein
MNVGYNLQVNISLLYIISNEFIIYRVLNIS